MSTTTPSLTERFAQLLAFKNDTAVHQRLVDDMRETVALGDSTRFRRLLDIFGETPGCHALATEIAGSDFSRWQTWRDIASALSSDNPNALPPLLGGAHDDVELANVRAFVDRFVNPSGLLPKVATDAILVQINGNNRGPWALATNEIVEVVMLPVAGEAGCVRIKDACGYTNIWLKKTA